MELLRLGSKFGDYDVVALVGHGAMGAVYRISDPRTGAEYACKVMNPEAAKHNPEYRKRFAREAAFAMKIRHPNLISVYDIGEDPDTGLCYLIMDFVSGGTVKDRLALEGRFSVEESVNIIAHIASALVVSHRMKVVHRDIKPANIMFDQKGQPRLADLGIARFGDPTPDTTVTSTGMVVGTPAYMAPEQMKNSHTVDIRADIYSLGIVFFEMLAGVRPNADCNAVELLAKAIKGEEIPDVRTIRPEVSGPVAQILKMMTAADPEKRIASPQQLVEMFSRLERDQALCIAPPAARRAFSLSRRQQRRLVKRVILALAFVAVFLVAFTLGSCSAESRHPAPSPAGAVN